MTMRQAMGAVIGLALLGAVGYWSTLLLGAEARVRALCARIQPGTTLPALRDFADRHGLRRPTRENGVDLLVERATFGRHGCRVVMEAGRVREVAYDAAL